MPEDMSDRMPEDLPVRKCINVMVGITRSKVIFEEKQFFPPKIFFLRKNCQTHTSLDRFFHL